MIIELKRRRLLQGSGIPWYQSMGFDSTMQKKFSQKIMNQDYRVFLYGICNMCGFVNQWKNMRPDSYTRNNNPHGHLTIKQLFKEETGMDAPIIQAIPTSPGEPCTITKQVKYCYLCDKKFPTTMSSIRHMERAKEHKYQKTMLKEDVTEETKDEYCLFLLTKQFNFFWNPEKS